MSNVVVLPIVIPVLVGILLMLVRSLNGLRWISALGLGLNACVSIYLAGQVKQHGTQVLYVGGWKAPYGITLVADMFPALLVATANVTAWIVLLYAIRTVGEGRERHFFHSFYQFLVAGVSGSFLTGDIFNLFVFFEVMLISSYALISLGATKVQLRESIKYLLINMVSSVLFVVSVGFLYGATGTLNMAHLSQRIAEYGQTDLLTLISLLFMFVFAMKAALFLFYWLPGSYSAPPTAIAALFAALMTKVGIYALIRTFTLMFYHEPDVTHQVLAWLAGLTIVLGTAGAVGSKNVKGVLTYNVVASVGFLVVGLAAANEPALQGTVYYLIHDIVIKALLFLVGGTVILVAGTDVVRRTGSLMQRYPMLGWLLFLTGFAIAGVPPLSGFLGKLLIVEGGLRAELYVLVGLSLLSSLLLLYSIVRLFMEAFWKPDPDGMPDRDPVRIRWLLVPCSLLSALSIALGVGAEWLAPYVEQAARTLLEPSEYIRAVLGG